MKAGYSANRIMIILPTKMQGLIKSAKAIFSGRFLLTIER